MGRDKASLTGEQGVDFLTHAVRRLEPVLRFRLRLRVRRSSHNAPTYRGPRSFIRSNQRSRAVLSVAKEESHDGCLVTPVDTPNLDEQDLRALIDVFQTTADRPACAMTKEDAGTPRLQPLIAIYPICFLRALFDSIEAKQYSLRRVLESTAYSAVALTARACHNINTPADLEAH